MRLSLPPSYSLRLEEGMELVTRVVACWACGMDKNRCPHCFHQVICVHLERLHKEEEHERDKKDQAP